eukprot:TRINITY_DN46916_c0_g1_i1.p1 TRINITY_DN46916_c0_g1~~TRINITY_DN46916_c0_g1_i1.p1  ORF type:complete len:1644 (+),score=471.09 TRINITY_DN46916_c0_g1_i1:102-5033(+)
MAASTDCPICFERFTEAPTMVPRILPCGHSLCTRCASASVTDGFVVCPSRCPSRFKVPAHGGVADLPKNFAILGAADDADGRSRSPPCSAASRQTERQRLEEAKRKAVEEENYDLAKQLKADIEALGSPEDEAAIEAHLDELTRRKAAAVECEDYDQAKILQLEIKELLEKREPPRETSCYELGGGLGHLLRVTPRQPAAPAPVARPQPIVILDRSPSMGGTARWAVNVAVPAAVKKLGYQNDDPITLLTFDSVTESVKVGRGYRARPMKVGDLPDADVSCQGSTTLLAPAVQRLGDEVRGVDGARPCIVFVISDGHVFDMPLVRSRVEEVLDRAAVGQRVAFSLFRFFNGEPPDTVALAAVASTGSTGSAPCVDCYPPPQWSCPRCTALNSCTVEVCEVCEARRPSGSAEAAGTDSRADALTNFVDTAWEAFKNSCVPHARVSATGELRRLPCHPRGQRHHRDSHEEVPYGENTYFVVERPGDALFIDGRRVELKTLRGQLPASELRHIEDFFAASLAQLKLWLVGGTRREEFGQAVDWFRRFSQQVSGAEGSSVVQSAIGRAIALKQRLMQGESNIGRLCALADATGFVGQHLNSKQQGDFLRGASVARADRLLSRRALGSDILFHDACREAVCRRPQFKEDNDAAAAARPAGEEDRIVSYYGGGNYRDYINAASILAPCGQDLSAVDILEVVGGLGAPISATIPSRVDDLWGWDVTGIDASCFLNEADVWVAKAAEDALRCADWPVTAVVPLEICGAEEHGIYERELSAIGLLHLGAQLRGSTPRGPWGWEQHAPYNLEVARGVREAAALRCAIRQYMSSTRESPSRAESLMTACLAKQLLSRREPLQADPTVTAMLRRLRGDTHTDSVRESTLATFVAVLLTADERGLDAQTARALYCLQFDAAGDCGAALRAPASVRGETVMKLLAKDPEQRCPVTADQVLVRLRSQLGVDEDASADSGTQVTPVCDLADGAEIIERLRALSWLPSAGSILGVHRVAKAVCGSGAAGLEDTATRLGQASPLSWNEVMFGAEPQPGFDRGVFFVALAAAGALYTGGTAQAAAAAAAVAGVEEAQAQLRILLEKSLVDDHEHRLSVAVADRMLERRQLGARAMTAATAPLVRLDLKCSAAPARQVQPDTQHVSFCICGNLKSGKSTVTGRVLLETGCVSQRDIERAQDRGAGGAEDAVLASLAHSEIFTRKMSVEGSKHKLQTDRYLATLIDVPGHSDFLSSTMRGIARADVGVLCVSADDNIEYNLDPQMEGDKFSGGARVHATMLYASGVQQLIVLVTKMDSSWAEYRQEKFERAKREITNMLVKCGWKKDLITAGTPFIPISAYEGVNIGYGSDARGKMPWWEGCVVKTADSREVRVCNLKEAVENFAAVPERQVSGTVRVPISHVFKIRGVGLVATGRVERGRVVPGDKIKFLPTGSGDFHAPQDAEERRRASNGRYYSKQQFVRQGRTREWDHARRLAGRAGHAVERCEGTVKSLERYHDSMREAVAGDIVGICVGGLATPPKPGDVLVPLAEPSPRITGFTCQVQSLSNCNIRIGFRSLAFARCGHACVVLRAIKYRQAKGAGGAKIESPERLFRGDVAELDFVFFGHTMPVEAFRDCAGLGRVCFFDSVYLRLVGKVLAVKTS